MIGYLFAPLAIGGIGCALGALAGSWGMNVMLDFYQDLVGLPIVERTVPSSIYFSVLCSTMLVVFLSGVFPALKASRLDPLEVLSGQNEMRVGSNKLRKLTSWMPTTLGLSIRSSVRKPIRLMMTFVAVGISLMLFGSVQMMGAGLQETMVGSLEDDQIWDVQVYIMSDAEGPVLDWAENNSANYEIIIEMPLGSVADSENIERLFNIVGLDSFQSGMRPISVIEGDFPNTNGVLPEVIMDEGSMGFLGWSVGEQQTVGINGVQQDVEIVGVSSSELARTMYFLRGDLSEILGVNATSIYLQLPEGVEVNSDLGKASTGIVERQTLLDGINSLLDQQTQIFQGMMYQFQTFRHQLVNRSTPANRYRCPQV